MRLILFLILFQTATVHATSGSLALLYGHGQLNDGDKSSENLEPKGPAYKMIFGLKGTKIFEVGVLLRYAHFTDETTYQGIDAKLNHRQLSYGVQMGAWIFPWLMPHIGYARHVFHEELDGNFSSLQSSQVAADYNLRHKTTAGPYGGVDFALLSSKSVQLFISYDYFHFNKLNTHSQEAMIGIRIYGDGEGGFMGSIFNGIIKTF